MPEVNCVADSLSCSCWSQKPVTGFPVCCTGEGNVFVTLHPQGRRFSWLGVESCLVPEVSVQELRLRTHQRPAASQLVHLSCFSFFSRKRDSEDFQLVSCETRGSERSFCQRLARLFKQASRMLFKQAAAFPCGAPWAGTCKSLYSFLLGFPGLVVTSTISTQ